ncbi:MAG: hypothetical protein JF596_21610, partial [Stenotrophomonas sp.]|nr:hypothetical protein [Stenotrophomonas sp.]
AELTTGEAYNEGWNECLHVVRHRVQAAISRWSSSPRLTQELGKLLGCPMPTTADQAAATAGDGVTERVEAGIAAAARYTKDNGYEHFTTGAIDAAVRAALASPIAPRVGVPEGWKLVPVETTVEMRESWMEANCSADAEWAAMLAAAPEVGHG